MLEKRFLPKHHETITQKYQTTDKKSDKKYTYKNRVQ